MVVKIIDIHNNHINITNISSVREEKDGTISMTPKHIDAPVFIDGVEILRSERPTFDCRTIKCMEIV